MLPGGLKYKIITGVENDLLEIAGKLERIAEYIKGSKGKEPDGEILDTVEADIEELWKELS